MYLCIHFRLFIDDPDIFEANFNLYIAGAHKLRKMFKGEGVAVSSKIHGGSPLEWRGGKKMSRHIRILKEIGFI